MNTEDAWKNWWDSEGRNMERLPHHDAVDHLASMTRIAWLNGAFDAADEIERLRTLANAKSAENVKNHFALRDAGKEIRVLQQEICRLVGEQANMTSIAVAQDRGWDCFRCGFCGVVDTLDCTGTCAACNREFYADK